MDNANKFTGKLDTSKLLGGSNLGWDEFRDLLNPILREGEKSIESKINNMVGDLDTYKEENILNTEDSQGTLNTLVEKVEGAFARLNGFYIALGKSSLKYTATYEGIINGENEKPLPDQLSNETRKFASFALGKGKSRKSLNPEFQIIPTDENGNTFTTDNNSHSGIDENFFGGPTSENPQTSYGAEITSDGECNKSELQATFGMFAQAFSELKTLRENLDIIQKKINSIKRVKEDTITHKASIQEALNNTEVSF